jgi:hypothetical protein
MCSVDDSVGDGCRCVGRVLLAEEGPVVAAVFEPALDGPVLHLVHDALRQVAPYCAKEGPGPCRRETNLEALMCEGERLRQQRSASEWG